MLFSLFVFFFKQKTAYEVRIRDWSSSVCSSDLVTMAALEPAAPLIKADIPAASIPAPRLASVTQPARAKNVSDYVVQLGAFSSAHSVNQAWKQISAQFPHIRGYTTFGNTAKINRDRQSVM